ncbi:hypothetical protein [Texcoconibacillus texcoconensis]|uniref:Nitrogen fixation protein FixH n=1 Tax=Texcoconibacillus texcoconensis TaxID=1095777 RepID=A0A840QPS0_9BACI|nr:hypothetical protein [Texcoconibacillus texcoconensis]MBB5173317.1 hypothetical protein [Texcoconibacillus texcoconensis]
MSEFKRSKQTKPQLTIPFILFGLIGLFMFIGIMNTMLSSELTPSLENVSENAEVYTKKEPVRIHERTTLQAYIGAFNDHDAKRIDVTARVNLQGGEDKKLQLRHVESGLFEADERFDEPGLWQGELFVSTDVDDVEIPFTLSVQP